jgi:endonuclease I
MRLSLKTSRLVAALAAAGFGAGAAQAEVFINEIHYDDSTSAGDVGERIEIVATAGETLSGYKLYLYNGSTPAAAAVYDTVTMPTGVAATCGSASIAYYDFTAAGKQIQNGSNDAIALVNGGGTVVQFLSYEGVATAVDGPAAGTGSTDILKAESSSTAAGTSLQLNGSGGTNYSDFTWSSSATATFGQCNTSQSFGTVTPPSEAPSVVSTTPLTGTLAFPADGDLRVTFSEEVTLASRAMKLTCKSLRLPISLSYPSGTAATSFLVDTAKTLPSGDSCIFTVVASKATDIEGKHPTQDTVVSFSVTKSKTDYYSHVNTTGGAAQLRCSLHEAIKGHTAYDYSDFGDEAIIDTWDILEVADEDPNTPANILDAYRNHSYVKVTERDGAGSGLVYNREHTWPNSYGFSSSTATLTDGTVVPNPPYTDINMLYLADKAYNADRGNKPYADCTSGCSEKTTEVNNGYGGPGQSNWVADPDGNGGSFQTWNHRKGDVARAVMYMAIRYEGAVATATTPAEPDLELTDDRSKIVKTSLSPAYMGLMSTLLAWHQADPVDAAEQERNEVVYGFQGNRNPFIDHPEWATASLFQSTQPAPGSCVLK